MTKIEQSIYRDLAYGEYQMQKICEHCGITEENEWKKLHIHHADENRSNNLRENLHILCQSCHTKHHHKWKKITEETKLKMSLARKGIPLNYTVWNKWLKWVTEAWNKWMKNCFSEETINKMKLAQARPVMQLTREWILCKVFGSIKNAEIETGFAQIWAVCNGKRKKAGGYYWEFVKS